MADNQHIDSNLLAAGLTGVIFGVVKWDSSISESAKTAILDLLIFYHKQYPIGISDDTIKEANELKQKLNEKRNAVGVLQGME